jgi:hypothetical protein
MKGYGVISPHDLDRDNPPTDGQVFDLLELSRSASARPGT